MTAVPHSPRTDDPMCTSLADNKTEQHHRSRLPAASIALGTLSIAAFWLVGLGLALGIAATICGAIATTRPAVTDDEAASLRALLGIVAGAAGITVSTGAALFRVLGQL
ncbi:MULTISPECIES: hypothetical protein [Rhodococcus]|uniref:DUF4190 domain-containing protein n=1 Tax=Rhodococcus qingshengii JCM 15477 TaxID=1303681 RepID=A0AB38RQ68_RHOSG|nr:MULTISPECIES: hypothetical protein [Rhodococcus]MCC4306703.1 hypothetical protein [Rhodococcus sp. 3-2]OMQ28728.1 hypothetical protein BK799_29045 [Rhodococcus sp. D-1]UPU47056.1 hypothetical protein M0639_33820 [Rhodococcus qingshengii JCM 15477]